jgi:very-short-patch-repair endonuclease
VQFYRQKPIADYIADFYAPAAKLVIERDGAQHLKPGQSKYDAQRNRIWSSKD